MSITTYLLAHQKTTAATLARHFGVSVRTIYRDIDLLSISGVPILCAQGAGGGISLMQGYTLERLPLSTQERGALLAAVGALRATQHPQATAVLEKLSVLFPGVNVDWIHVEYADFGAPTGQPNVFALAQLAVIEHRLFRFVYDSMKGERTQRTLEPYRLWFRGDTWYLWGHCLTRDSARLFRLERMTQPQVLEERFAPRAGFSLERMLQEQGHWDVRTVQLDLLFAPTERYRLAGYCDSAAQEVMPDGRLHVHLTFPMDEWVYSWLLSFGDRVQVCAPAHIQAELRARLMGALVHYHQDEREAPTHGCKT